MAMYSWFTHWKMWFSIVMLVYQRVYFISTQHPHPSLMVVTLDSNVERSSDPSDPFNIPDKDVAQHEIYLNGLVWVGKILTGETMFLFPSNRGVSGFNFPLNRILNTSNDHLIYNQNITHQPTLHYTIEFTPPTSLPKRLRPSLEGTPF